MFWEAAGGCAGSPGLAADVEGGHLTQLWQLCSNIEVIQLPSPNLIRADLKMDFANHSDRSVLLETLQSEKGENNKTPPIYSPSP